MIPKQLTSPLRGKRKAIALYLTIAPVSYGKNSVSFVFLMSNFIIE